MTTTPIEDRVDEYLAKTGNATAGPETVSTTVDTSPAAKQAALCDEKYDEPDDAAIRRELGLRPTGYSDSDPEYHPDQRPCPSWCWIGQSNGEYAHELDPRRPMTARHTMNGTPRVVASLYQGSIDRGSGSWLHPATIESHLEQIGQAAAPTVRVCLRTREASSGSTRSSSSRSPMLRSWPRP